MAFNFIPKSSEEIAKKSLQTGSEIINLYDYLVKKQPSIKDPLAIDVAKPKTIKIMRDLSAKFTIRELNRYAPNLNLSWGNGSRGGAGTMNRGNLFETELEDDLNRYINEGLDAKFGDSINKKFITEFAKQYSLHEGTLKIKGMGALNQKRSLQFQGDQPLIGGANFNIGSTVTDITVNHSGRDIFLSLKLGGTVTFFNAGVSTILNQREMQTGMVSNRQGIAVLDLFGIDNVKFCKVFNNYGKGLPVEITTENTFSKINISKLKKFIMSGIGYGYHLVHKERNTIHHMNISESDLSKFSTPSSCMVRYPIGEAKRIDIFVETPKFSLKFNIRNKQGGLYPSHIMSDYKTKH